MNGGAAARFAPSTPRKSSSMRTCNGWPTSSCCGAQALTRELGMPIGLYGDYAVGANPSGSETWVDQASYCLGAEIGAPPDPLALKGQGWGIPPQDPVVHAGAAAARVRPLDPQQHALLRRAAAGSCDVAVPTVVGSGRMLARRGRLCALSAAAAADRAGAGERAQRLPGRGRRSRRRAGRDAPGHARIRPVSLQGAVVREDGRPISAPG